MENTAEVFLIYFTLSNKILNNLTKAFLLVILGLGLSLSSPWRSRPALSSSSSSGGGSLPTTSAPGFLVCVVKVLT